MKITVIKTATSAKPMMGCPIIVDDSGLAKR
jgi:inosine/xanthosine triphosphate pyrophosphatase family protein